MISFPEISIDFTNPLIFNIYKDMKIQEFITFYDLNTEFPKDLNFFGKNYYFIIHEIINITYVRPFGYEKILDFCIKLIQSNIFGNEFLNFFIKETIKYIPQILYKIYGKKIINKEDIINSIPEDQSKFFFQEINNNFSHTKSFLNEWPIDSIGYIIKYDEIEKFLNLNCDLNLKIEVNNYENRILNKSYFLVDLASFYGSIKIFKFLLINKVNITNFTIDMLFRGGNFEMIRIYNSNPEFYKDFGLNKSLITYRHYEIYYWIYQNDISKYYSLNEIDLWFFLLYISKYGLMNNFSFEGCLEKGYLSVIQFLLNFNFDINEKLPFYNDFNFRFSSLLMSNQKKTNYTPLLSLSILSYPCYFSEFLILNGASIFTYDSKCKTCLQYSEESTNECLKKLIFDRKKIIEIIESSIREENLENIKFYLQNTINLNCENELVFSFFNLEEHHYI